MLLRLLLRLMFGLGYLVLFRFQLLLVLVCEGVVLVFTFQPEVSSVMDPQAVLLLTGVDVDGLFWGGEFCVCGGGGMLNLGVFFSPCSVCVGGCVVWLFVVVRGEVFTLFLVIVLFYLLFPIVGVFVILFVVVGLFVCCFG